MTEQTYAYRRGIVYNQKTGATAFYADSSSEARRVRDQLNKGIVTIEQIGTPVFCQVQVGAFSKGTCGNSIYQEDAAGYATHICEQCGAAMAGEPCHLPLNRYAMAKGRTWTADDISRLACERERVHLRPVAVSAETVISAAQPDERPVKRNRNVRDEEYALNMAAIEAGRARKSGTVTVVDERAGTVYVEPTPAGLVSDATGMDLEESRQTVLQAVAARNAMSVQMRATTSGHVEQALMDAILAFDGALQTRYGYEATRAIVGMALATLPR